MKCKNCGTELEDGEVICPKCGADSTLALPEEEMTPVEETGSEAETPSVEAPTAEQTTPAEEKKKLSTGKIVLLTVLAVVAVALVATLIFFGVTGGNVNTTGETNAVDSTEPSATVETTEATIPADGNPDDVTCKGSYTADDDTVLAAKDTVVATLGDQTLTVGDLQVYYWLQFYDFMDYFGSYASYVGLNTAQSLDTQISMDGTTTWQQYFLDSALSVWQNYSALSQQAKAAGFVLDEEIAASLAELPQTLNTNAQDAGFADADEMIRADMGVGASADSYKKYLENYYSGYLYYSQMLESIELTDEEVEAYFDANAESYGENGVEKDDSVYVDVRHILVTPEGGTTDEDGNTTYSDEEWEACRAAAQELLDQWMGGEQTEESFAALANEKSEDPGSNTNGGLYENVYKGQMVEPFEEWCFDASRQYGDYGLVKTTYGYHVMYFVDSEPVWHATAWEDLMTDKGTEMLEEAKAAYPTQIDYSAIVLGQVNLGTSEE